MADHVSPPTARPRPRVPSGPRPAPLPLRSSPTSSRHTSTASVPKSAAQSLKQQPSLTSLSRLAQTSESPLDALLDSEADFTVSLEESPQLRPTASGSSRDVKQYPSSVGPVYQPIAQPARGVTQMVTALPMSRESSQVRSQTMPDPKKPGTPSSFIVSRPSTPTGIISPIKQKSRPKVSKLNTVNLVAPNSSSPTKMVSPGLKHWQQVRSHVMAPTPAEEKAAQHAGRPGGKKLGLVSKAAGRFGFRHAAEEVIGYRERRQTMAGLMADMDGLSIEEQEQVARERRKFARDVKACLDACALEESRRRLWRVGYGRDPKSLNHFDTKSSGASVHASVHTAQKFTFDPDFSAFAPLLMELHKHLPAARAKRLWSRTCPHHSAILAELGVAFLQDSTSTDGERQQALEVFGAVVKNWAADSADEELERWLWLCRVLITDDRQLRNRGLTLLNNFLHSESSLPRSHDRPHSALAFLSLASALIVLLHAVETSGYGNEAHLVTVNGLLADLSEGDIIQVEEASLAELLGSIELSGSLGGVEKELLWVASGSVIGTHPSLAHWFLSDEGQIFQRLQPPPVLHATPPLTLRLRSRATCVFLSSWTSIIRSSTDLQLSSTILRSVRELLLPEFDHLPDEDETLASHLGSFLLELELQGFRANRVPVDEALDPFRISMGPKSVTTVPTGHHDLIVRYFGLEAPRKKGFEGAAKEVSFLQTKAFVPLGRMGIEALFSRFTASTGPFTEARPFLVWLAKAQPQQLYKPLFKLSASTQPSSLTSHLKLITVLSQLVGPTQFWTQADPQMVTIVLMGDVAPKQSKGKAKEGETSVVNVKLGRYAVLVGFINALDNVKEFAGSGSRLRPFMEAVESRLALFLEAEERDGTLPISYRLLICQLLLKMRSITSSVKRSPWIRLVMTWFIDVSRQITEQTDNDQVAILRTVYQGLAVTDSSAIPTATYPSSLMEKSFRRDSVLVSDRHRAVFDKNIGEVIPRLLVAVHACLSIDDWGTLLPHLWHYYTSNRPAKKALAFLLEKCAELISSQMRAVILSDLTSSNIVVRNQALRKMAMLFGWRNQVLAQKIVTDRRGPVFQFSAKTLDFVATDIGSITWVAPHDVQDAALQKFGQTLPPELRQRLMELGWAEDATLGAKSDWEAVPVSSLPALQYQQDGLSADRSPSPMRALKRHASSSSGSSFAGKRRRHVFAPMLFRLVNEQVLVLAGDIEGSIGTISHELIRLVQRDDAAAFLRPITSEFKTDFAGSLLRLNSVLTTVTPAFAYSALNALVGYVKSVARTDPNFAYLGIALATIARLVPHTSGISLRDIRKNKAEHVILPASIHEDEGGFKVHGPWRDGSLAIQTAQLLILAEGLRVNPREVYLVKKMLSNLQIQGSIHHLPFARGWLILIITLFSAVNRNYNDRAELRHFLTNVGVILRMHGEHDLLVTVHAMRVFMLCSARFRRLFTSMGFPTIMRPVYETYAAGNAATRDCIEYAAKSFYRIHQDSFVYQTCIVISEGEYDAAAVYSLLSSLSVDRSSASGVPSGIRGLNDQEEIEALVQMISGPEIALSEIGTDAAERQAKKLASITLDDDIFPKENIVRLFVTIIAANPASSRARSFLRLLAALVPHIKDPASEELLREGVEALGSVIVKGKTGDESAMSALHPGSEDSTIDWVATRREYVFLVESYARSGGRLGASATKRTLDMVLDLLQRQPESVGPAASSIVGELAKTHLSSVRPTPFLRDIAPLFRMFIAVVDFSGMLDSITTLIRRSSYDLDLETTSIIVQDYVEPSVRMLATASEENMAFIVPLRSSAVRLLSAAVFLRGDALGALERYPPGANLLASLVLPLCLLLESPQEVDRAAIYSSLWIRILHYVIRSSSSRKKHTRISSKVPESSHVRAATVVLTVQIIKVIVVRAPESLSDVKGLWTYIARHLLRTIEDGNAHFIDPTSVSLTSPRLVDWIMWSLFELLCLHRSPLQIEFRCKMQLALAAIHRDVEVERSSNPSTPGVGAPKMSTSPQLLSGRARVSSSRSPSYAYHARVPSGASAFSMGGDVRSPGGRRASDQHPGSGSGSGILGGGHSRMPSQQHLSPHLSPSISTPGFGGGHSRMPSTGSMLGGNGMVRPSFAALSARRASRPAFDAFPNGVGMNFRFPSSAGQVRSLAGPSMGNDKPIVHLLNVGLPIPSSTTTGSTNFSPISPLGGGMNSPFGTGVGAMGGEAVLREMRITSDKLSEEARKAVRRVMMVNGWEVEVEEEEEAVRTWSVMDALHVISEQTKVFVEEEFRDIFSPNTSSTEWTDGVKLDEKDIMFRESMGTEPEGYDIEGGEEGYSFKLNEKRRPSELDSFEEEGRTKVPMLSVSVSSP
ncbi:hypothetical protein CI109_101016 [Kwoniella shandongensis]|uniref:Protein UNC80 C-terminal domain-containing protein n=1 Tax=Kwoniella shandongensis TaxID=1734106 RepID=A0AAJ8LCP1_9TREE